MHAVSAEHYHRKRYPLVMVERHLPSVAVAEMLEDCLLDVEGAVFLLHVLVMRGIGGAVGGSVVLSRGPE